MKVLVCGDRGWSDWALIEARLKRLAPDTTIIHGDCRGADKMAGFTAKKLGLNVQAVPADWEKYGRVAGPIRNREMLDRKPALVLAFHQDLSKSAGTRDTVKEAAKRRIPTEVIARGRVLCGGCALEDHGAHMTGFEGVTIDCDCPCNL